MSSKKEDFLHSKKFNRFLHNEEEKLKTSVLKLFGLFFLILIGLNSYQIFRLTQAFSSVKQYNQGVVVEVGQMKEALAHFGNDLNEIRSYLYLPTRTYFMPEEEDEAPRDESVQEGSPINQALYQLLTETAEKKKNKEVFEKHCALIESLYGNETFAKQMTEENLNLSELNKTDDLCSFKLLQGELAIYNLLASPGNTKGILIQSALGEQPLPLNEEVEQKIVDYLKNKGEKALHLKQKLDAQKTDLENLLVTPNPQAALNEKQWSVSLEPQETREAFVYSIQSAEGEVVSEIKIDRKTGHYQWAGKSYPDASSLEEAFLDSLNELNPSPDSKMDKKAELEAIFKEKAFQALLKENAFTLNPSPRQENGRLLYDLKNSQGEVEVSIMLDVGSGELLLQRGNEELDLLSILHPTGEEKKNLELPDRLPNYDPTPKTEGLTILVAGKNASLVDTLMVLRLAEGKIKVVSVPRDLYWNGRKINSLYAFYGMEELVRVLSELSGYKIDHYILIDMFAFIEVVDKIGCLDLTLEKPLVDPTYKTLDKGVWSTLYYPAGTHHLCGKQALRVARSRHTSSDFSRAERQHLILEALKNKAQAIGLKDAKRLKKLAEITLKYTETDLNPTEAIAYYFRFKEFEMKGGHVLSSGNVLESTSTGALQKLTSCKINEEGEEVCPPVSPGAFILLPRHGNWNAIKWFFQQAFEGEK